MNLIDTYFKVHEHGYIALKGILGGDAEIEQSARVSYGKGTRAKSDTETLIRYLRRNRHSTPFESPCLTFHVKLPIFVERQWIRHRGDSSPISTNEMSLRYSEAEDDFYIPTKFPKQSKSNKQGSDGVISEQDTCKFMCCEGSLNSYQTYQVLLNFGVSREIARTVLPVSTYTKKYWTLNLHNLFHFLKLRLHPHAQQEIRDYAHVIACIVREEVPIAFKAFLDYDLNRIEMSAEELKAMQYSNSGDDSREWDYKPYTGADYLKDSGYSKREIDEYYAKINFKPTPLEYFDYSKLTTFTPEGE